MRVCQCVEEVCKFSTELAFFEQVGSALLLNACLEEERKIMELFYQELRLYRIITKSHVGSELYKSVERLINRILAKLYPLVG